MKIVADHKIPFLKGAFEGTADMVYVPGKEISREVVADADALIVRTRTRCNIDLLSGSKVRCVASATIGYDHIDTDYCENNGIYWTNAPGCNADSVKQYVASALAFIIQHEGKKISEITLGIIGAGHVGSRVDIMARSLGVNTLVNDPPRARKEGSDAFVDIESLLAQSDIVTLHVPLQREGLDKTYHMADASFFSMMKPGAWFINTSRGEASATKDLSNVLKNNYLAGAIIDVWEHEPNVSDELLELANMATPHIAGYSSDGKANGTTMSVRAVSRYFGMGLDHWSPKSLPKPEKPVIQLSCIGKTPEQVFYQLAMHTYNLEQDSLKLKASPETFERQREDYPVRREPPAFKVHFDQTHEPSTLIAKALGFSVIDIKKSKVIGL